MTRKNFLYFLISVCLILISTLACAEVIDKIAIVVNNEVITQGEIDRLLAPIYEQYKPLYHGDELIQKLEEARQKIIEQLIEDKLMLSEAKKLNIEIDDRDVEGRLDETIKRFGPKERFEQALSEQHLTLKDLRSRFKEQLMTRRLIDQKIGSRIMVTPVEIQNYYDKHINEFVQPEEIKLWNILVKLKPGLNAEKASELAKEILKRLQTGEDFAGLAKIYSEGPNAVDGGLMGYVKRGELLPEIEKAVFNLKDGEISDIIQTSLGYHIFKLEERRASRTLPLPEVRHEIEEAIFREKVRGKIKGWIEGLKKNAYIAFK